MPNLQICNLLKAANWSSRKIAAHLRRSGNVINGYVSNLVKYRTQKSSGSPKRLDDRAKRRIVHTALSENKSCKIQQEIAPEALKSTIWNVLKNTPHTSHQKMNASLRLKDHHKLARLNFARLHVSWTHQWDRTIWIDGTRNRIWTDQTTFHHIGVSHVFSQSEISEVVR